MITFDALLGAVRLLLSFSFIRMFGRETVERLVNHIDDQSGQIKRLIDNVAQLTREKDGLQNELAQANDAVVRFKRKLDEASQAPKRVELPREVADAILSFWDDGGDVDELIFSLVDGATSPRLNIIRGYGKENGLDLISALVNGFTFVIPEQTMEDRIRERLSAELIAQNVFCSTPPAELARLLTLAVQEVLAEERPEQETTI